MIKLNQPSGGLERHLEATRSRPVNSITGVKSRFNSLRHSGSRRYFLKPTNTRKAAARHPTAYS